MAAEVYTLATGSDTSVTATQRRFESAERVPGSFILLLEIRYLKVFERNSSQNAS